MTMVMSGGHSPPYDYGIMPQGVMEYWRIGVMFKGILAIEDNTPALQKSRIGIIMDL
jgi:hypothetical protein